jgi:hypothetical protein
VCSSDLFPAADQVAVATNGVERVNLGNSATVFNDGGADVDFRVESDTVDHALFVEGSSGNVGIGTSSPSSFAKQTIQFEAGGDVLSAMSLIAYGGSPSIGFRQASGTIASPGASNTAVINLIGASTSDGTNFFNTVAIQGNMESTATSGSHPTLILFATTPSGSTSRLERMRIDSSGNVMIGTTGAVGQLTVAKNGERCLTLSNTATGSAANQLANFLRNGVEVGAITSTNTTTTYATLSDYRLKENIAPMTGALGKVAALKPCTYTWKVDGSAGEGFIAHELQAVVPDAVYGEKDAVETYIDEEDIEQTRPVYQGVDTSFLVATLTAAIQELKAELDEAKARIATLEAGA